ncbi:MAG TPA: ribosome silencing factor [Elusimicrobiales bacterium]|nr:ribosome silencing factor [Elusimicrobiales bacterium]
MTLTKNDSRKIAIKAARAGDSKKASPVQVYDLCGSSSLADFVVLLTVESAPQLEAVEEEVSVQLKADGTYCLYRDGMRSKNWKVLDYGGVMVHVFDGKAEEFYSIGKLYGGHKPVQWEENAPAAPKPAVQEAQEKPAAKKAPAKKPAAKKAAVKKPAAKKAPAKKAAAKKPAAKKAAVKKPLAKKGAGKKAAVKKAAKKTSKKK